MFQKCTFSINLEKLTGGSPVRDLMHTKIQKLIKKERE